MANGDEFESNGRRTQDTMSVRLPGGAVVSFTSRWIVVILLLMAATSVGSISMFLLYEHKKESLQDRGVVAARVLAGQQEILLATKAEISGLRAEQIKTTDAQNELNYIMTLTPEQREKLKLRMPDSLRKKLAGTQE